MIIKAYDADTGYYSMYDNVTEILYFQPTPQRFTSGDKLEAYHDHVDEHVDYDIDLTCSPFLISIYQDDFPEGGAYYLNRIKFKRANGKSYRLTVEEQCYICNDEGKSLEKVAAGGFKPNESVSHG